jgi:DNA-directed RNA polymerase subunit RPC12/RpoP
MAIYRCGDCHENEIVPRPYRLHLGKSCQCPRCGTKRLTKLKARDKIDPMERGFLNLLERWAGGKLYHCKFCRIQFWDRRRWSPPAPGKGQTPQKPEAGDGAAAPADEGAPAPKGSRA